jgi:WD40 repeat protein
MKVFDEEFNLIQSFKAHPTNIERIKQSPFSSDRVATCSFDYTVKIWNPTNNMWSLVRTFTGHTQPVYALEFLNANTIASGSSNIQIWSLNTGSVNRNITSGSVFSLKLLSNGIHLAAGLSGTIRIYNINTGALVSNLTGHSDYVIDMAFDW